jgi:hypothetical protein
MDEFDADVFSPELEARVCEQVLGDARHGLQVVTLDRSDVALRALGRAFRVISVGS